MTDKKITVRITNEVIAARTREYLEKRLPEFFTTEMDGGVFVRTLDRPEGGQVFEYGGKEWEVEYSWEWTTLGHVPIYVAELQPVGYDPYAGDDEEEDA